MPSKVGKYQLDKTLGTGAFSKVKLGIDTETSKKFAIKIIDKERMHQEHMEEQLMREISTMKVLDHSNVVKLFDVMQSKKHIYMVLELVSGGEIFDKIVEAKKFDEDRARRYFQQLIAGVAYCQSKGIAHRDLKPENILLDEKDNIKITDFGLANLQKKEETGMQTVCGTPNYVAPEVLREAGYNGHKADIWSCGVVLFVFLAGYLPFEDENLNKLFNKIERGDYRMARHFSDSVKDLVTRMLKVDPNERITLEEVINHEWVAPGFDKSALSFADRS